VPVADVFTQVATTSAAVAATSVVVVEETEPFTVTLTLATVLTLAHRRAAVVQAVALAAVAEAVVALEVDSVVVHALAVAAEEAVLEVADDSLVISTTLDMTDRD
jgi:hypothetical protein